MPTPRFAPAALAAAGALLLALSQPAPAQAAPTDDDGDHDGAGATHWGLGLGLASERRPYKEIATKTEVIPVVFFENRWVRAFGAGLELKVAHAGDFAFTLRGRYSLLDGYKPSDAPILANMDQRRPSFWLGPAARWTNPIATVGAEWQGDVSGYSKGQQFRLTVEREFRRGALGLAPHVEERWLDRKYVDYYFGVRADEALPERPAYGGRSTLDTEIGLKIDYRFLERQMVFLDVGATRLGKGIEASPLVGHIVEPGARVGYIYRF